MTPTHSAPDRRCPTTERLCECGKEPGTFACKIRHLHLNTGDAKASKD